MFENFFVKINDLRSSEPIRLSYATCTKHCQNLIRFKTALFRCYIFNVFVIILLSGYCYQSTLAYFPQKNTVLLDPCEKCKITADSFRLGLYRTSRGKHEGGDAHWEENKLNNYLDSEIRLTEVQEHICIELTDDKDQCHSAAEELEEHFEHWFFNERKQERLRNQKEGETLQEYICYNRSKVCCPSGHFGADCQPCRGYPDHVCFGRGHCSGNGTRFGNGKCVCHEGFGGQDCEKCSSTFKSEGEIEIKLNGKIHKLPEKCYQCDVSCASTCHSSGPKGCSVCKDGYIWDTTDGCIDVDECSKKELNSCKHSSYCVNTLGSFKCFRKCLETLNTCPKKQSTIELIEKCSKLQADLENRLHLKKA
ncbi:Cysteine-rich with EGF-like domain protein 2 [Sarcoptes scabiei]|uniref:Cysteine-rich with EGF-like domain protein 2 n=1 Tax=Sarcoptes scabiei TaxID=52283 RepID=A0A834R664_SARSC|nr:Cysteine-rich with EGF-like domain protein 2 [Sarcoptes scabiei]